MVDFGSKVTVNTTGLVFGKAFQDSIGGWAYVIGTSVHFIFALAWSVAFAFAWPWFKNRGWEETLVGLLVAPLLWVAMHVPIPILGDDQTLPNTNRSTDLLCTLSILA